MTKFKFLFIVIISVFHSCSSAKNKDLKAEKLNIKLSTESSSMNPNHKNISNQTDPKTEDFIQAFEKQIIFYKTETKENLIEFLGISKERINSISNKEFNELVRDGNAYLYENLINEFKKDNAKFEVLSNENNILKVSFKEKGNDNAEIIMNFEDTEDGLIVAKKASD